MSSTGDMSGRELTPVENQRFVRDEGRVKRGFWNKARRNLNRVPFLIDLLSAYFCAGDSATPLRVKATLVAALAYFVVPTDLLPDFIAGIGFSDDATVLYAAINTVASHIKPLHRDRAAALLARWRADPGHGDLGHGGPHATDET